MPLNKQTKLNLSSAQNRCTKLLFCNGYFQRKWTRWPEFKFWTRLIGFHIALIYLGNVWIQLFSLQLCVNSWPDWSFLTCYGNLSRRKKKYEFKPVKLPLKIDLESHLTRAEGLGKYISTTYMRCDQKVSKVGGRSKEKHSDSKQAAQMLYSYPLICYRLMKKERKKEKRKKGGWFSLAGFDGISTFVGYLMQNPFLYK